MEAKARNVMSNKLISIRAGSSANTALHLMTEKRIRHLAVVNDFDEVVGVISSYILSNLRNPELIGVESFLNKAPLFVDQNSPLRSAILKMLSEKVSSLLISDENGEAVGIMTTDDLLWHLAHLLEKDKNTQFSLTSLFDLQTVGEAARQLALAGI